MPSRASKEARLGRHPNRNKKPDLGRTKSEIGLGKSMAASGRKVSRTNLGKPSAPRPTRARRTPLATPEVQSAVERLRKRFTPPGRTRSEQDLKDNMELSTERNQSERKLENAALRQLPTRPEALAAENRIRANTSLNAEGTQVEKFRGKGIVGTPSVGSVTKAARKRQLRGKDNLTTPEVRQTKRQVKRARRQVRRARAQMRTGIEGPLTPGQKKFAEELAKRTAINPRVAGAWVLAEMSGSAATGREAEGNHNWLNIAYYDSGPGSITKDAVWSDPVSAAKASAQFLRGQKFGPSEGIKGILPQSRGASDERQIQAISTSGWASSGYEGGDSLRGTRDLIGFTPARPGAKRRLNRALAKAETVDEEAARLGLPGTKGLSKEGKRDLEENFRIRQEKGDWAGSQALIQKILKAGPNLASDKEDRGTDSFHDTDNLTAYAQDIPISGGLEEGEPVYDQALLDRVTRRIRRMGGEVPDLVMGMGYTTGYLQGYTLEIIPDSLTNSHGTGPHLHIGAKWTGTKPPPGTQLGGGSSVATGSVGPGGTTFPSTSPSAPSGPTGRKRRQSTILNALRRPEVAGQLRSMGFRVTRDGVFRTNGESLSQTEFEKVKERMGIK